MIDQSTPTGARDKVNIPKESRLTWILPWATWRKNIQQLLFGRKPGSLSIRWRYGERLIPKWFKHYASKCVDREIKSCSLEAELNPLDSNLSSRRLNSEACKPIDRCFWAFKLSVRFSSGYKELIEISLPKITQSEFQLLAAFRCASPSRYLKSLLEGNRPQCSVWIKPLN